MFTTHPPQISRKASPTPKLVINQVFRIPRVWMQMQDMLKKLKGSYDSAKVCISREKHAASNYPILQFLV